MTAFEISTRKDPYFHVILWDASQDELVPFGVFAGLVIDEVDWGRDCYPGSQLKSSEQKEWTPPLSSVGALAALPREVLVKLVFNDSLIDHSYSCPPSINKQS